MKYTLLRQELKNTETYKIIKKEIHKIKQNKDEKSINIGLSKHFNEMKESVLLNFPKESEHLKDFLSR